MRRQWVLLAIAIAYVLLLVVFYRVPYGGEFNRDDAGSVADWTAGIATVATLVYLVLQRKDDHQRDREAEFESIHLAVRHAVVQDPLLGNPVQVTVELRHLGERPIYLACFRVVHGEMTQSAPPATVFPEGHRAEVPRVLLNVSVGDFREDLLTAEAQWVDVWRVTRTRRWPMPPGRQ